jgi:DNA-binding NarL/FixJ family response regulator
MCRGDLKVPSDILTSREREVVKLIAEGKKNREIADLLCISIRTVENHRANIMKKLKLKNTSELVKYAIRKKYVGVHT